MGRHARALSCIRRLTALALLLLPSLALASNYQIHQPNPHGAPRVIRVIGNEALVNQGARTIIEGTVTETKYGSASYKIGGAALGKLAKGAAGQLVRKGLPYYGAYTTIKELAELADWVQKTPEGQNWPQWFLNDARDQASLNSAAWCVGSGQNRRCSNSPGNLSHAAHLNNPNASQPCSFSSTSGSGGAVYKCRNANTGGDIFSGETLQSMPAGGWQQWNNANPEAYPGTPVTDQQMGDLVLNAGPEVIKAVLVDPETGQPIRTKELTDALNKLRKSIEDALKRGGKNVTDGTDVTVPDETEYPEDGEPQLSDWPTFCSWADVVCDFIDWVKADDKPYEKPEVPFEELPPEPVEWSSGLGSGACPAPWSFSVSIGGTTANPEISLQPLCDLASILRPLVIAISLVVAAFIIAGLRNNKGA